MLRRAVPSRNTCSNSSRVAASGSTPSSRPQHLFALVIGAQRAGAVVIAGVQANQRLVVRLGQRIQCHQPFGVAYGRGIVAAGFRAGSSGG